MRIFKRALALCLCSLMFASCNKVENNGNVETEQSKITVAMTVAGQDVVLEVDPDEVFKELGQSDMLDIYKASERLDNIRYIVNDYNVLSAEDENTVNMICDALYKNTGVICGVYVSADTKMAEEAEQLWVSANDGVKATVMLYSCGDDESCWFSDDIITVSNEQRGEGSGQEALISVWETYMLYKESGLTAQIKMFCSDLASTIGFVAYLGMLNWELGDNYSDPNIITWEDFVYETYKGTSLGGEEFEEEDIFLNGDI